MNRLKECQKEFLFNSRYGYDECHPTYKLVEYTCNKTDKRIAGCIEKITINDFIALNKEIYEAMCLACNECSYNN